MRRTILGLLILGLAGTLSVPASAAILLNETFPYANGDLTTVSGGAWVTHSGMSGADVQVSSGQAVGDMLQSLDDNRPFAARSATAKTYARFLVTIPAIVGTPRTNYFVHFKDSGTFNFTSRLFVAPSGPGFTFAIGTSGTPGATWPSQLAYDTQYTIVTSYDAATGVAEMWVNPANESSPKVTTPAGTTGFEIEAIALRQSNTGTGTAWTFRVDDIEIHTTFPSPELSINNVSQFEGNAGGSAFTFTVSMSKLSSSDVSVDREHGRRFGHRGEQRLCGRVHHAHDSRGAVERHRGCSGSRGQHQRGS